MRRLLFLPLLLSSLVCIAQTRSKTTVLLYPEGQLGHAEYVNGLSGPEDMQPHGYLRNVSDSARFDVYLPESNSGVMVVICPGGGYGEISTINEGAKAAEWFNSHGVAAAVLTYRLPNGHCEVPLEDVQRTFHYCRDHASEFGVHTIGIFGASAGGHLAATASVYYKDVQTRPDFTVLFYPVITLHEDLTDPGTRRRLVGESPSPEQVDKYSLDIQVDSNTPSCYIILSADDSIVPVRNSYLYEDALRRSGVPVEIHLLEEGGHGWGFNRAPAELESSLGPWLKRRDYTLGHAKSLILENPLRAVNYFHSYEPSSLEDTPAPEGYEPFYISHIGRHGSRYNTDLKSFDRYLSQLDEYAKMWKLTKDGKKLYSALEDLYEANEGHLGDLSDLGREEHKAISRRMQERFPQVFSDPYRRKINATSTGVKRVKESREAFLSQFDGFEIARPENKAAVSGTEATKQMRDRFRELESRRYSRAKTDDLSDMTRLVAKTFRKVPEKYDRNDVYRLFAGLFMIAGTRQCIGFESPVLDSYFTPEEAYTFWYESNTNVFQSFCISAENEGEKAYTRAGAILEAIIKDADAALEGNDVAADLRFSHDTYVQPLLSIIGAEGNEYHGSAGWANTHFCAFTSVPMGVNLQIVFYKRNEPSGDSEILVKLLHNEKEVIIPSLETAGGVYYEWSRLRSYLVSLL